MANNQNNNNATNGPWREGRPSFKAFYPEIFLLTLITIFFVAVAVKLSYSAIRKAKEVGNDKPAVVSLDAAFLTASAFAQDVAIEEIASVLDEPAPAVQEAEPAQEEAAPAQQEAAPAQEEAAPAQQEAAPVDVSSVAENAGQPEQAAPTPDVKEKAPFPWSKLVWIWVICLIAPVALWGWRGSCWLFTVWGVYFELRVDPDNPRATTFLTTRGVFNKKTDSLHIGAIKDIQSRQSFVQKYFMGGVGTIILFTNDLTDGRLEMKNMSEPSRIFNSLDALRRNYWSRGGMQLHSGGELGAGEEADGGDDAFHAV